nr:winged helix DNA-binding domain-containing protein [Kribbella sandramycini]
MTVLHATESASVHLSLWARVAGVSVDDVEQALYADRTLIKQMAMRRTLFVFPRDLVPAAWGSASKRVAVQTRTQLTKMLTDAGIADGAAIQTWLDTAAEQVTELLSDGVARTAREIRDHVPALDGRVSYGGEGTKWSGATPVGPVVLTLLGAEGRLMRAANAGHWRLNKPAWTTTEHWLKDVEPLDETAGYTELIRRWLATFGPGTEADIVWWLGSTKTAVRRALADLNAVEVSIDNGTGWVLPGDDAETPEVEPWAALLPALDPTVMGWKERDFYLDPADKPFLFDTNGNGGTTAWWNGRIVGCWVQDADDPAAPVRLIIHADVDAHARKLLDAEADRLTAWLDGVRISNVYASPQMRGQRLP